MSFQNRRILRSPQSTEKQAEPKAASWLGEIRLLIFSLFFIFWLFSIISHSSHDPAWSTTGTQTTTDNWFGLAGAYFSDLSFYIFGYSVWWLLLSMSAKLFQQIARQLKGIHHPTATIKSRTLFWAGLIMLICASASLEWSRLFYLERETTAVSGGILGFLVGLGLIKLLGAVGSAIFDIVFVAIGLSLTFNFSWGNISEKIGKYISNLWINRAKKHELSKDKALGEKASKERKQQQEEAQHQHLTESTESLSPSPAKIVITHSPTFESSQSIGNSERIAKESQQPLFIEHPDTKLPQISLLDPIPHHIETISKETLEFTSRLIEIKLKEFGVEARVMVAQPGPVITRYEIEPAVGVKGSQIVVLAKDLARALSITSIRVVENVPGKAYMALELPNAKRQSISLSEILGSNDYNQAKSMLTLGLGKDIVGNPVVTDLAKMPHLLVAGTTGSGKSVGINAMVLSLLYKAEPKDVRLLLIDPKMLEMSVYQDIPHLLAPVVTDMKQAAYGLNWCVFEMEKRYKLMSKLGVRNLAGYNSKIDEAIAKEQPIANPFSLMPEAPEPLARLPYIVVVIDELADLIMVVGKKIEELIARLAQKARASGIHLILATQRPSVDVITGLIKANVPSRISFKVSSKIDSRTILDEMGSESLLGLGDMLFKPGTGLVTRIHGAYVSDEEVHRVVEYLKSFGEPDYVEGVLEGSATSNESESSNGLYAFGGNGGEKDALYDQAVEIVLKNRKASISLIQRHLKIGYNRAARLVEDMEKAGLVSTMNNQGQRDILMPTRGDDY